MILKNMVHGYKPRKNPGGGHSTGRRRAGFRKKFTRHVNKHVNVDGMKVAVKAHVHAAYTKYAKQLIAVHVQNKGERMDKEQYKEALHKLMEKFVKHNVAAHLGLDRDSKALNLITNVLKSGTSHLVDSGARMASKLEKEMPGGKVLGNALNSVFSEIEGKGLEGIADLSNLFI